MPGTPPTPPRLFVVGSFVEAHCWTVATRPRPDESQLAHGYVRECAGKGLAVAVGAHRLGAAVDLLAWREALPLAVCQRWPGPLVLHRGLLVAQDR